ncbi:hypothetical protein ruthe_00737 [Rubellimicrobium thermophilum DSM 16684]|uniref:DUF1150 family protein n=1 Tax=Rubellimicrobium thermophilum DSM 16684 TaxID=1123069 RepID=S9R5S0_9RHOB|nr:hypothetical protein ruthe_00737 [Rubellimicrobium thermophilum DSM 16684]
MNGPANTTGRRLPSLSDLSPDIVYVKPVSVASLPEPIRMQAGGLQTIFAVHDIEGHQLALVADRNLAFVLARQHDKVPVTVH